MSSNFVSYMPVFSPSLFESKKITIMSRDRIRTYDPKIGRGTTTTPPVFLKWVDIKTHHISTVKLEVKIYVINIRKKKTMEKLGFIIIN